ncbi:MAG TPA: hypothetical protein VEA69_20160 [Tepidisphaeraceae bacterium]|nr:hypothetical protein [Tepidisphaeraceae bacterium]
MIPRTHRRTFLAGALACSLAPFARAADDLDLGNGLEGETGVRPVDWEPVITRFTIRPRQDANPGDKSAGVEPLEVRQVNQLPSFRAAWLTVKPIIPIRDSAYPADAPVVSGWELRKTRTDTGFENEEIGAFVHAAGLENAPLQTILASQDARIEVGFDILMPVEPAQKDTWVKSFFQVNHLELSGPYHVADSWADPRAPAPTDAKPDKIHLNVLRKDASFGAVYSDAIPAGNRPVGEFIPRTKGLKELRLTLTVGGRFPGQSEYQLKTVNAAIRFGAVEQAVDIRVLSADHMKKDPKKPKPDSSVPGRAGGGASPQ